MVKTKEKTKSYRKKELVFSVQDWVSLEIWYLFALPYQPEPITTFLAPIKEHYFGLQGCLALHGWRGSCALWCGFLTLLIYVSNIFWCWTWKIFDPWNYDGLDLQTRLLTPSLAIYLNSFALIRSFICDIMHIFFNNMWSVYQEFSFNVVVPMLLKEKRFSIQIFCFV